MKLNEKDVELFYKLNWHLLLYVNQKYRVIKGLDSPDFRGEDANKIMKLHKKLFSHPEIIDSFVFENPFNFTDKELEIVKSWKNYVEGEFFIISHLKNYTIFLSSEDEPKAYGVLGLMSEIEDVVRPHLPLLCWTVLLPFKGRIVYCGFINSKNIYFGGGMKRSIKREFQKAKSKFGIITSLDSPVFQKESADEELLRFYLRSEKRRYEYWDEIVELLDKNPSLMKVYHLEIGKSNARKIKKRLSEIGIPSRWFAVFEDTVIASGESKEEVMKQINEILPEEKRGYIHVFRYAKKG